MASVNIPISGNMLAHWLLMAPSKTTELLTFRYVVAEHHFAQL